MPILPTPQHRSRLLRGLLTTLGAAAVLGSAPAAFAQRGGQTPAPRIDPAQPRVDPETARRPAGATGAAGDDEAAASTLRVPEGKLFTWFSYMDLDGNGWLSFRETSAPLGFDRGRFRAFDLDKDGRLQLAEYRQFYTFELERGLTPEPPRTNAAATKLAPRRDPQQLRMAFDRDLDGALDVTEFGTLLAAYGRPDVDAKISFSRVDGNGDQRLDASELSRVASLVDPIQRRPNATGETAIARTLEELVGPYQDRGTLGQPPRIVGPVPSFWRLDLDRDGAIEGEDLRGLQGQVHLSISVPAVLATLDTDGDGRLSALEFAMCLDPKIVPEGAKPTR